MSTVGHPDYQRVTHGFVAQSIIPSTPFIIPAGGQHGVSLGFPTSPDVLLVEIAAPINGLCYVELDDDNGNAQVTRVLGSINLGTTYAFAVRSFGNAATLHLINGDVAQQGFTVAARGFIGIQPEELNVKSVNQSSFNRLVNPGATTQVYDPPAMGRFDRFDYIVTCDQPFTPNEVYLFQGATTAVTLVVPQPAQAANAIYQQSRSMVGATAGVSVTNTGAAVGHVNLEVVGKGSVI